MICPCGSGLELADCCEPYLEGVKKAPTAEILMRSRYTAHVLGKIAYIRDTIAPEKRSEFDEKGVREWATQSEWMGIKILSAEEKARKGTVEFVVTYKSEEKVLEHHEVASFRKDATLGIWYFVDGDAHVHEEGQEHDPAPRTPIVRDSPKIGRNDPCSCGSGKKYKKCCGA